MNIYPERKVMRVAVIGMYKAEDGPEFAAAYAKHVAQINPSESTLVLDASELIATKMDLVPDLSAAFKAYMSTGFKEYITVQPKSAVCRMQLTRAASNVNFPSNFVDSWSPEGV